MGIDRPKDSRERVKRLGRDGQRFKGRVAMFLYCLKYVGDPKRARRGASGS